MKRNISVRIIEELSRNGKQEWDTLFDYSLLKRRKGHVHVRFVIY